MMYPFIYWLKTLAAVLITNSHYSDIWPISSLAAGGHLGNCLFFLVSGFCLYHIQDPFPTWYAKRAFRIYPALWVFTAINILTGFFSVCSPWDAVSYLIYPTWYHFVGSIMVLYILFYLWRKSKTGTRTALIATAIIYAGVYLFCFDKSRYHIDDVEETWVRFQFFTSMLLGARLRENFDKIGTEITIGQQIRFVFLFVAYFAGKVALGQFRSLSPFQCFLPVLLVALTYRIAFTAVQLEKRGFFSSTARLNKAMQFISAMTLEIYLGQHLIIDRLSHLPFPADLLIVTGAIIGYAWVVHHLVCRLKAGCGTICKG